MGTLTSILSLTSEGEEALVHCIAGVRITFKDINIKTSGEKIIIDLVGSLVLISFLLTLIKNF